MKLVARCILVLLLCLPVCMTVACNKTKSEDSESIKQTYETEEIREGAEENDYYSQLVVGTYVDILNTRDFAEEVADYLNGEYNEKAYSDDGIKNIINDSIRNAIIIDGGLVEGGKLDETIERLIEEGLIGEENRESSVEEVVRDFIINSDEYTDAQLVNEIEKDIADNTFLSDNNYDEDELYVGPSASEWEEILLIREELGYKQYDINTILKMLGFVSDYKDYRFAVVVKSNDLKEAESIARICEIVVPEYIERCYPGAFSMTSNGVVPYKNALEDKGMCVYFQLSSEEIENKLSTTQK